MLTIPLFTEKTSAHLSVERQTRLQDNEEQKEYAHEDGVLDTVLHGLLLPSLLTFRLRSAATAPSAVITAQIILQVEAARDGGNGRGPEDVQVVAVVEENEGKGEQLPPLVAHYVH